MTGYETFGLYESLKLHFSKDSYDFFKYNGKTNISITVFENRKDKYHFYKLSRKYSNKDILIDFLVANLLKDEKIWVGKLLEEDSEVTFRSRQKVIQSLSYVFENDCINLFENTNDPNSILKTDGDYPKLLTMQTRKEVTIETVCLLNQILNFLPMWEKKITDTIMAPIHLRKIKKYTPFLPSDIVKYKLILKKVLGK